MVSCGGFFCGMALQPLYAPMYPLAALCTGLLLQISPGGAVLISGMVSMSWALGAGGFTAVTDGAPGLALGLCSYGAVVDLSGVAGEIACFSPAASGIRRRRHNDSDKQAPAAICPNLSFFGVIV